MSMKVSVSLPEDDVEFLDKYARSRGGESRSAALHHAIRLLRTSELSDAYEQAWREWYDAGEEGAWEHALADGLGG